MDQNLENLRRDRERLGERIGGFCELAKTALDLLNNPQVQECLDGFSQGVRRAVSVTAKPEAQPAD